MPPLTREVVNALLHCLRACGAWWVCLKVMRGSLSLQVGVMEFLSPLLDAKTLSLLEPSLAHVNNYVKTAFQEALSSSVLPELQR